MKNAIFLATAIGIAAVVGFHATVDAQSVYRCERADGSITYSDLPCRSDIGSESMVDVTPHQGLRPDHETGRPAYTLDDAAPPPDPAGGRRDRPEPPAAADRLPRSERLSLQRERKSLLSDLKRRHTEPADRRVMIRELRALDQRLGLGPGDVPEMPPHDQDVYEEYSIYP